MYQTKVSSKINKFAIPQIDIGVFHSFMEATDEDTPITIFWSKLDGDRTVRDMYWGEYKGGKASQTRSEEGLIALVSVDDGDEYRTVDLGSVWKCIYDGKTYYVK